MKDRSDEVDNWLSLPLLFQNTFAACKWQGYGGGEKVGPGPKVKSCPFIRSQFRPNTVHYLREWRNLQWRMDPFLGSIQSKPSHIPYRDHESLLV
jgi:hypothetical protein